MDDFFDDWEFPAFEALLADVPHSVAVSLIERLKVELNDAFENFETWREWSFVTAWEGHEGAHLSLGVHHFKDEDNPWGWDGFPVDIHLSPEGFAEAVERSLKDYTNSDGFLSDKSHTELLAALAEWRAAIDRAEQVVEVLKAPPPD